MFINKADHKKNKNLRTFELIMLFKSLTIQHYVVYIQAQFTYPW